LSVRLSKEEKDGRMREPSQYERYGVWQTIFEGVLMVWN